MPANLDRGQSRSAFRPAGTSDTRASVDKQRWMVGATVELPLPAQFSIGVDALYRRLGYSTNRSVGSAQFFENSRTAHWEFPIYGKYHFAAGHIRPFLTGGGAFEHANTTGTAGCTGDPMLCGQGTGELKSSSWGGGVSVGGGAEFRAGVLNIAPEFRYTRWLRGYFAGAGSDQPQLLLGIRF